MKNAFLAVSFIFILFTACKEIGPNINMGNANIPTDTTYVLTTAPTADPHNVLVEEFTGQSCPNCPAAHELLIGLQNTNPGRLNVIGFYIYGNPQTIPPNGYKYDFRDSAGTSVGGTIYLGVPVLPCGGVDRMHCPSNDIPSSPLLFKSPSWTSFINTRMTISDSLNLSLAGSVYDTSTKTATIVAKITYVNQVTIAQNLNIAVVEDSMIDLQDDGVSGIVPNYVFTGVFRSMVTSVPYGDPIAPTLAVKEAGRVCQKVYSWKLKPGLVAKHCRIIAYVTNSGGAGSDVVYQSVQIPLQ